MSRKKSNALSMKSVVVKAKLKSYLSAEEDRIGRKKREKSMKKKKEKSIIKYFKTKLSPCSFSFSFMQEDWFILLSIFQSSKEPPLFGTHNIILHE